MTIEIPQEVVALSTDAENQIIIAKGFVIRDQSDHQLAADQLRQIKNKAKALEDRRKAMTQPLDAAKKSIMDFFRRPGEFLTEAENIIKSAMLHYSKQEESRRREEERKAQEALRIAAEEAKAKADAEAAELKAQAEADMALARETGNDDIAAMILENAAQTVLAPLPVFVPEYVPEVQAPKVQGASIRKVYRAEVADKLALCRAIADGKVHHRFVDANMPALNNEATAAKEDFSIPGCTVVVVESVVSR